MRSVRSHPGYDITITLVSPRPDVIDVQWDIEKAVEGITNIVLSYIQFNSRHVFIISHLPKAVFAFSIHPWIYLFLFPRSNARNSTHVFLMTICLCTFFYCFIKCLVTENKVSCKFFLFCKRLCVNTKINTSKCFSANFFPKD